MKEQIWLTKKLRLSAYYLIGISIFYIHIYTISEDTGMNIEKVVCLQNKESASAHTFERTTMVVKCELFMNCSKKTV